MLFMIILYGWIYIFVYIFKVVGMVMVLVFEGWVMKDDFMFGDMFKVLKWWWWLKDV